MQKKTEKVTFVLDYFSQIVKRFMLREKYSQKSRGRYCNVNYKTKFIWIVGYGLCNRRMEKGKLVFGLFSQNLKRCMLREKKVVSKAVEGVAL